MWRILLAVPVAWLVGLATYVLALRLLWGQSIGRGDAIAVMVWSLVALFIAAPLAYWPALALLSRALHGYRPRWLFVMVAVAIGIAPTALILLYWGGGLADLISPEGQLFYCKFAAVGVVLGIAFSFRRGSSD